MAKLLDAKVVAKRAGMGVRKFRNICRAGLGPPVFNPLDGGIPKYVDENVDAWLKARDDRAGRKAS